MICLLGVISSCCNRPKNMFVLVPDPGGKVGRIVIENKGGKQIVSKANMAVQVQNAKTPPTIPEPVSQKEIEKTFTAAISVAPQPPVRFHLFFKSGGAKLTEASHNMLPKILATIKKRMPCDILVIGHTDTKGNAEKNWKLGLKRAEIIKGILERLGVNPRHVETASFGEKALLVPTPDNVSEPKNRFVEIIVQ